MPGAVPNRTEDAGDRTGIAAGVLCPKRRCRGPGPRAAGTVRRRTGGAGTGVRVVPGVRGVAAAPAPRLRGRGWTTCRPPRPGRRPAPAPPRCRRRSQRGSAQHGGDAARPAPPRRRLLPALRPARYRGRPPEGYRGGPGERGGVPARSRSAGERPSGQRRDPRAPPPAGGAAGGGSGEPSPGTEASGERRLGLGPETRAKCPRPRAQSPRRRAGKVARGCSAGGRRGGGAEGGRRAPLSRQQRGRPPRPCPYKAAAGSARPAGAAPPPAEPGRVRLPGPAGNPRGCAGRGAASPEALAHPPASGPASPLPPTLQLSGAYEPAAELPTEGTPDKARAPPPACRHWAPSSRRAAGEEAMPVSGTEQEADPGPRQPLPGCISARLHEQHVPTWAGAVCSVALTAPATDNADRALPRGRERAPSRGAVAIPP